MKDINLGSLDVGNLIPEILLGRSYAVDYLMAYPL